jgi:muramoyltetrapeptide carboxypeptidase
VRLGTHVYQRRGYLAGEDHARLSDLHDMFSDAEIRAIFCARGGYGSVRLLDKIDYDLIKENPKILVGYSDITALLMAIYKETGLVTFHGPMVRELNRRGEGNWRSLLNLISLNQPFKVSLRQGSALRKGKATGTLLGGNLSLICHLLGTPFLPSLDDCILFLEEKGEPLYRLDRMMTHLRLSHSLDRLVGLVAGHFEGCGDPSVINRFLADQWTDLEIPAGTGLTVGHGDTNVAVPLGLTAHLDMDTMTLSTTDGPCR